jgi:predicted nucleotidyltransferase component of viral defense system
MQYETPVAFRQALEERLRQREQETGEPLVRMRKRLVFERCMVRLQKNSGSPWVVKGGFALELRMGLRARMTKDLDLCVDIGYFGGKKLSSAEVAQKLREDMDGAGEDGFVFVVSEGEEQRQIPGVQAYRFTVEARLAGRRFETIRVDVGMGDPLILPLETLKGSDLLSFAEVPSPRIRATSLAQHLAEKVHALTRPFKESISSRVKDLADIMLLMNVGLPDPPVVRNSVDEIFAARRSHDVPKQIDDPPATWASSFAAMARELGLKEQTLDSAIARLNDYWKTLFP